MFISGGEGGVSSEVSSDVSADGSDVFSAVAPLQMNSNLKPISFVPTEYLAVLVTGRVPQRVTEAEIAAVTEQGCVPSMSA